MKRDFRITARILGEYGFTVGCKGCEAKLTGSGVKPHSVACTARTQETMRAAGRDEEVSDRRGARIRQRVREQRHSHRRGRGTHENSPEDVSDQTLRSSEGHIEESYQQTMASALKH